MGRRLWRGEFSSEMSMNFSCRVENDARRCVRKIGGAIRSNEVGWIFFSKKKSIVSIDGSVLLSYVQINSFFFLIQNSKFYYINQIKDYPIVSIG